MPNSEESRQRSPKTTIQQTPVKAWTGQPYPAYKDSGVEWLGKVPEHWEVRRLKYWLGINRKVLPEDTNPGYTFRYIDIGSVAAGRLIESPKRLRFGDAPSRARRVVTHGDTIISTVRTYLKAVWHAENPQESLVASTGFAVLTPDQNTVPKFVSYICQSNSFTDRVTSESVGIAYPAIAETRLGTFSVCIPPLPEQHVIAHFLDHANQRIQRHIHAKEKLIKLLEEQKQVIIHQAVTGQIDVRTGQPYPAYKDSGVEWLGKVPEHWDLVRLKHIARVQTGLTLGKDYRSTSTISRPYLRVANVQTDRLDLTKVKSIDVPSDEADRATLLNGDVLMTEGGDIDKLGRGCVWRDEIPNCLHQNHVFAVRCRQNILIPEFLVGLMSSHHGRTYFQVTAKQTTNLASTNSNILRAFPIPLPPLKDQKSICHLIHQETSTLTNLVRKMERQINLLHEYRTRLIADVVTGKLDVREAAAELPRHGPPTTDNACQDGMALAAQVRSRHP